ncbi:MAG: glycosyltransferase WbsX family protein [Aeromonas hydrophila]
MLYSNDKVFCFYFPQFYPTPENDFHWGKGFTDWDNVKKSVKLFDNHRQPRVPLNATYYVQSEPAVICEQAALAKKYGVDGFSFYHYWFDGKLTLEKPLENFLKNKDIDLEFCLTWANESWSKRWVGEDDVCIFKQTHANDITLWKLHFDYLYQAWSDPRHLKLDGKPVFVVYNPHLITCAQEMFSFWNQELEAKMGVGLHIVSVMVSPFSIGSSTDIYSSEVNFEPRYSYNSDSFKKKSFFASKIFQPLRYLPESILNKITKLRYKLSSYEVVDYQAVWDVLVNKCEQRALTNPNGFNFYGCFVDWDNTPRYKNKSKVYHGANPDVFAEKFKLLLDKTSCLGSGQDKRLFFINAWNEWSEGTYLEPDSVYGYQYLEKIKNLRIN